MSQRSTPGREVITISQGDTIHHPFHGIGQVESIRKRSFSGENQSAFVEVFFKRDGLTLMLREKDLENTVRKPLSKADAKKLLDHLEGWSGNVRREWKARANANQQAIERGDPFGYADVYKGLSKLEQEGTLRTTDRAHLNRSLDFLAEELANALGKTPEQARDQIAQV